ncbi:MAG: PQQ-dependent sugar dehydrogenase [Pseudomonadota bacterium]
MNTLRRLWLFVCIGLITAMSVAGGAGATDGWDTHAVQYRHYTLLMRLPAGFKVELLNTAMRAPRLITATDNGSLLIGSRSGALYHLAPPLKELTTLITWGDTPQSVVAMRDHLLLAGTEGIYRANYRDGQPINPDEVTKLLPLPGGPGHDSRTLRQGPDGNLYVSIGITGNCSDEYLSEDYPADKRRGGIWRLVNENDTYRLEPFGTGLRNPIGFDWHPDTGRMYASNNGPDHLGYDQPPEVFAEITPGSFHGMPWFQYNGTSVQPDDCIRSDPPQSIDAVRPPVATFPARNAPMAVAFVPKGALHREFEGDAIVALRGSWATQPHGTGNGDPATRRPPKLVRVTFADGKPVGVEDFAVGFQRDDGRRWLRPVGLAFGPKGALYLTSDGGLHGLLRISAVQ